MNAPILKVRRNDNPGREERIRLGESDYTLTDTARITRKGNFFIFEVDGNVLPLINGEAVGEHLLHHGDVIEMPQLHAEFYQTPKRAYRWSVMTLVVVFAAAVAAWWLLKPPPSVPEAHTEAQPIQPTEHLSASPIPVPSPAAASSKPLPAGPPPRNDAELATRFLEADQSYAIRALRPENLYLAIKTWRSITTSNTATAYGTSLAEMAMDRLDTATAELESEIESLKRAFRTSLHQNKESAAKAQLQEIMARIPDPTHEHHIWASEQFTKLGIE